MKRPFLTKRTNLKVCNMMPVNLEKKLEYLQIQECLRSENFTDYYFCIMEYFNLFLSTSTYIPQAKNKIIHWTS